MARYLLRDLLLTLVCASTGATGCIFSGDDETEPTPSHVEDGSSDEDAPPNKPIQPYQEDDAYDPCVSGMTIELDGRVMTIPVPCNKGWVDKGDPPPEGPVSG